MFITQLILAVISFLGLSIGIFINLKMFFSWINRIRSKGTLDVKY